MRPSATFPLAAALLLALAGCQVVIPQPSFHKVDPEAPAFKEAVAKETERQAKRGKSAHQAQAIAERKVTRQTIETETNRRNDQVLPLAQALEKLSQPRGCWAYTVTTTSRKDGKTTVDVARFDAYQPEDKLWTLISRDGQPPDEETQAHYRRTQLRAWLRAQERSESRRWEHRAAHDRMWDFVSMADVTVAGPDDGYTTFIMKRVHGRVPVFGEIPAARRTYVLDEAQQVVLRQTEVIEEPASMLGGSFKMQTWEAASEYIVVDRQVPPFPSRTKVRYRGQLLGKDSGDVEVETVYSDHRRVKCYDERFSVRLGELNVMDFLPEEK